MTLPHERTRSVIQVREFLEELRRDTALPQVVRDGAFRLLRHYPFDYQVLRAGWMEENPSWIPVAGPLFSSSIHWENPARGAYDLCHTNDKLEKIHAFQIRIEGALSRPYESFREALEALQEAAATGSVADGEILAYLRGGRTLSIPPTFWRVDPRAVVRNAATTHQDDSSSSSLDQPGEDSTSRPLLSRACNDLIVAAVGRWLAEEIRRRDGTLHRFFQEFSESRNTVTKRLSALLPTERDDGRDELDAQEREIGEIWQELLTFFGGKEASALDWMYQRCWAINGDRPIDRLFTRPEDVRYVIGQFAY